MIDTVKDNSFIITLTGPSGSGKTEVAKRIMALHDSLGKEGLSFKPMLLPKYATRAMRRKEIIEKNEGKPIDIITVDVIPEDCDLKYQTYGKQYGARVKDIRTLMENGQSPVVVINDVRVVEELKKEFPNRVLALFLFREIPKKESFTKEAKARGGEAAKEIEDRFNKATAIYRTYIENIGIFNRVILNVGNENTPDYAKIQIEHLVRSILIGELSLAAKRDGKPKLFIIAGHAKSGKDEIIKAVDDMGRLQASIIRKYTSRRQDEDDGKEMICRLIPSPALIKKYENEYKTEVEALDLQYEEEKNDLGKDIQKLADAEERWLTKRKAITKPAMRFWIDLEQEEGKVADIIRHRILDETDKCHRLESMDLYNKSVDELKTIYCTKGYHAESVDNPSIRCEQLQTGQSIINAIIEETSVENDVTETKVNKIKKLNDLITLYKKEGYHRLGADIEYPDREKERVERDLFSKNPDYIDLSDMLVRHQNATAERNKTKRLNPTDRACFLRDGETGYILYENNRTQYGFEVYDFAKKEYILFSKLKNENKHLVLVASLPEIFEWCEKYTKRNVVTVFAHSEISAEEFAKVATSDSAMRKLDRYKEEIMKYSENITKFDHVTILAEEHINQIPGAREEELIDQIFRLFRFYNGK